MFKIAKLENVSNEKVIVNLITQEQSKYKDSKKILFETFKTLSFNIFENDYSFSFDLNCKLEELLKIQVNKIIDFKK